MSTKLLEEIEKDISFREYGYKDVEDFVKDAVQRRKLELEKLNFLTSVMIIKKALKSSQLNEKDIIDDFEKFYHSQK